MKKTTRLLALSVAVALSGCGSDDATTDATTEVPDEVAAVIDDWWDANERGDGSVVELYRASGYHLYGDERVARNELAEHFGSGSSGDEHEWITEPLLIAAEPDGRYVVARGMRITNGGESWASALTFEIMTSANGELEIAQSEWMYANG